MKFIALLFTVFAIVSVGAGRPGPQLPSTISTSCRS